MSAVGLFGGSLALCTSRGTDIGPGHGLNGRMRRLMPNEHNGEYLTAVPELHRIADKRDRRGAELLFQRPA